MQSTISNRLQMLRTWMNKAALDAVIITNTDEHQSEYTHPHYHVRSYVSGFSGSAGTLAVTKTKAGLWTDSRYFLEAEAVLAETSIQLFRQGNTGVCDYPEWLAQTLETHTVVGMNDTVFSAHQWHNIEVILKKRNIRVVNIQDPFQELWEDRPALPLSEIYALPEYLTGETTSSKLHRIRKKMKTYGAACHIISTLDDIAWIVNLRGSDIPFTPVFMAHMLIWLDKAELYIHASRLTDAAKHALQKARITLMPYTQFPSSQLDSESLLINFEKCSRAAVSSITSRNIISAVQPSTEMKACKNKTELEKLRLAMKEDGAAMIRFLMYLDTHAPSNGETHSTLNEINLSEMLCHFRSMGENYCYDSFETISAIGANAAIIHYRVQKDTAGALCAPALYLADSGGQYKTGTTDITRTVAIGTPDTAMMKDFTYVLRAHIAAAQAVFPMGSTGRDIDTIARTRLWQKMRNYEHGTGHGVGHFLCVHEGPQVLSSKNADYPLQAGMVISNEPGLYRTGKYGIRIENLLTVQHAGQSEFGKFFCFETLSLCPIDRRLVMPALLSSQELTWLNTYHKKVRHTLSPLLNDAEQKWLHKATQKIYAVTAAEE